MQFLIDNLTATIITSIIIIMAMTVNIRTQQTMTETTSFHAMMKQSESFIQIIRRDMQGITEVQTVVGSAASDDEFCFMGIIGTNTIPDEICYRPTEVSAAYIEVTSDSTVEVPIYSLTRTVWGEPSGGTIDMFTSWEVQCFSGNDTLRVGDVASTCTSMSVSFEAIPRLGNISSVAQMQWEARFFPPILNENN